jgi:hypothetical protein
MRRRYGGLRSGIEARALELILTDPKAQTLVIDILKTAKRKLNRIKAERDFEFASCTPPWKRCADNVCRPDCDEDERLPDEPLPMEFESLGRGRNRPVG